MTGDCFQSTPGFSLVCGGNVNRFTVGGAFLDSWDTGHYNVFAVRPIDGDLLAVGAGELALTQPSAIGVGVASRVSAATKSRVWDSAIQCAARYSYLPRTFPTSDLWFWNLHYIDPLGNTYIDGGNISFADRRSVRYTKTGAEEAPAWWAAFPQLYLSVWSDQIVTTRVQSPAGTHHLTLRQNDGTMVWEKTLSNLVDHCALTPSNKIWTLRSTGSLVLHNATGTEASVSSGCETALVSLSDDSAVVGSSTGNLKRYSAAGTLIFSSSLGSPIRDLIIDTSDRLFAVVQNDPTMLLYSLRNKSAATVQQRQITNGAFLQGYNVSKMGASLCAFAEGGELWIGGCREVQ